jgi:hypothetical protein
VRSERVDNGEVSGEVANCRDRCSILFAVAHGSVQFQSGHLQLENMYFGLQQVKLDIGDHSVAVS